jgi:hypothetical protein
MARIKLCKNPQCDANKGALMEASHVYIRRGGAISHLAPRITLRASCVSAMAGTTTAVTAPLRNP